MGHGAPTNVDDIPLYLKNIRGGTDSSPEVIQIIRDRYEAIGGSSPLLEITKGQADELEKFINQNGGNFKVYIGMRNWAPYIRDVVKQMLEDGVEKIIALCLAPQYSTWSTKRYLHAFNEALEKNLKGVVVTEILSKSPLSFLLDSGDIIVELQKQAINNTKDLENISKDISKNGDKTLLIRFINRRNQPSYGTVKIK